MHGYYPERAANEVREQGTACHWVAYQLWHGHAVPAGTLAPNRVAIDDDMLDACERYFEELRKVPAPVELERTIAIRRIHAQCGGTVDAWAFDPMQRVLYVYDLKYGFRFVDVFENLQLVCYVAGLLDLIGTDDVHVEFMIYQPRAFHRDGVARRWRVHATKLYALFAFLADAARAVMGDNPRCVANAGCGDCNGRHACEAAQRAAADAVEFSSQGSPVDLTPLEIGPELARIQQAIEHLTARATGLEQEALHHLRKGVHVPLFSLQGGTGREVWQEGADAKVIALGMLSGVNLTKQPQAITPKQARKLLGPGVIDMYAHTPTTSVKLVRTTDKSARKAFT